MKSVILFALAIVGSYSCIGQALIGTWQLSDEKTCFQSEMNNMKESDTEKELKNAMGKTRQSVAQIISFDKKGNYEQGIYSQGKKKGSNVQKFEYRVSGEEIQLIDKKSGMATQRYMIDELTTTTLRFHNAIKDCEIKTFIRVD